MASAGLHPRIAARDEALKTALEDLSNAHGRVPPSKRPQGLEALVPGYLGFAARECTRELFGMVCQSKIPSVNAWMDTNDLATSSVDDASFVDELSESLLLLAYIQENAPAGSAETADELILRLHVGHRTPVKNSTTGKVDKALGDCIGLSESFAALKDVLGVDTTGSLAYLLREVSKSARLGIQSIGPRVYYSLGYVGDLTHGLTVANYLPVRIQQAVYARTQPALQATVQVLPDARMTRTDRRMR